MNDRPVHRYLRPMQRKQKRDGTLTERNSKYVLGSFMSSTGNWQASCAACPWVGAICRTRHDATDDLLDHHYVGQLAQ